MTQVLIERTMIMTGDVISRHSVAMVTAAVFLKNDRMNHMYGFHEFPGVPSLAHATWYTASLCPAKVIEHNGWQSLPVVVHASGGSQRLILGWWWLSHQWPTTPSDLTSPEFLPIVCNAYTTNIL